MKSAIKKAIFNYRKATWRSRNLPDFMIIGAQKSGTSSLYYYLSQHSQISPSYVKEVHFFDGGLKPDFDNFKQGQSWYLSHFPRAGKTVKNQKTFDSSPLYIFNPIVPKRISEIIPKAKLIAILRNPTERAISHYFYEKKLGYESLPIMDALLAEEERLKPILEQQDYKHTNFIHFSYKSRGHYYDQIKRYLNYFSMSNILFINSAMLFSHPEITLRRVFNFIGVDDDFFVKDLHACNVSQNRTKVAANIYEYLDNYYYSQNHLLYKLIGENFGW
ncbi:sulfotransferase [Acaryochloris marina]|uniref:sulfotransferase family protein n=1 Tax=Acaryochloris marina TaxID=155978 RepID=UPI002017FAEF|nr:sulfotransferase [Acaryochloris marina]